MDAVKPVVWCNLHSKHGGMGWLSSGQVFFSCSHVRRHSPWYLWLHGVRMIVPRRPYDDSRKFSTNASVARGCRQMAQTSSIISSPSERLISNLYLQSFPRIHSRKQSKGPYLPWRYRTPPMSAASMVAVIQRGRSRGQRRREAGHPLKQQRKKMFTRYRAKKCLQMECFSLRMILKRTCKRGMRAQRRMLLDCERSPVEDMAQAQQSRPQKVSQGKKG